MRTEYRKGYEDGFARGLAWFDADELAYIALHTPPGTDTLAESIREKLARLETYSSVTLLAQIEPR